MRGPFRRSHRLRFELSLTQAVVVSLGILVFGFLLYRPQRRSLEMYLGISLQNVAHNGGRCQVRQVNRVRKRREPLAVLFGPVPTDPQL
jgi:hypothetical protein